VLVRRVEILGVPFNAAGTTSGVARAPAALPGGIAWDALTRLTRGAMANPGLLGWDVTIYNPDLDPSGADAKRIVRFVTEAIGV
jgi:arginase